MVAFLRTVRLLSYKAIMKLIIYITMCLTGKYLEMKKLFKKVLLKKLLLCTISSLWGSNFFQILWLYISVCTCLHTTASTMTACGGSRRTKNKILSHESWSLCFVSEGECILKWVLTWNWYFCSHWGRINVFAHIYTVLSDFRKIELKTAISFTVILHWFSFFLQMNSEE